MGLFGKLRFLPASFRRPPRRSPYSFNNKNVANKIKMTQFGDLTTEKAQKALNDYLASRSYIEGYVPSQADVTTFAAFKSEPCCELAHAARWYRHIKSYTTDEQKSFPAVESTAKVEQNKDDDEVEDAENERIKKERVEAYHEKKSKKTALIAKSSLLLDVKPWDDETDMAKMEELVRIIVIDGLVWGQSKLVPLAYGIKKLQIGCVIEDDKVSTDILEEEITKFSDYVQSMDVAAFNKI